MGDEHGGQLQFAVDLKEIGCQIVPRQGIERAERLIHQHDMGFGGERAGQPDALALAAGQFRRIAVAILLHRQADEGEQFGDAGGDARLVPAEKAGRDRHIFPHRHMREKANPLKNIAHMAAQGDGIGGGGILPVDPDGARTGFGQPVDQVEGGGLARAGFADQDHDLTCRNGEIQAVDGGRALRAELLGDALKLDHRGSHSSSG